MYDDSIWPGTLAIGGVMVVCIIVLAVAIGLTQNYLDDRKAERDIRVMTFERGCPEHAK